MDEKKVEGGKPTIDKEYLKRLAEKIRAEKARREGTSPSAPETPQTLPPPPPPPPPRPAATPPKPPAPSTPISAIGEEETEGMEAEKTAIIDLALLSGQNADARIVVIDGKDEGKALDLTRDEIIVGRSLDNDLVISDISVSRKHFKIIRDTDGFKVEDLGSGNGIRLNGKKESRAVLFDGDLITAGARTIRFEILNPTLKEKYSRKGLKDAVEEGIAAKSRSPLLAWVAIIMVLVVGAGGFYLFYTQQQQQKALQLKLEQEDMLDSIDKALEERNFSEAERLIDTFVSKYPGVKTREIERAKKAAQKEKVHAANFEEGRKRLAENKVAEAEAFFKLIPDDSLFYRDVVALVGKERIIAWVLNDVEDLLKVNKIDEAIRKTSSVLLEDPANKRANELMAAIRAQVGAQKVETIQTSVAKEKEQKKQEEAERERRKQELISKGKITETPKPKPTVPAPKKPTPKPPETKSSYTMDDIQGAIETYVLKDFDGAITKLELIANASDEQVRKKARDLIEKIKNFKSAYEKKNSKKAIVLDKQISGGKLKEELASLDETGSSKKKSAVEDEFAVESSSSASKSYDENKAKTLYMEAVSLKESDPEAAKEKFREVLKYASPDGKYYQKAKKALKE